MTDERGRAEFDAWEPRGPFERIQKQMTQMEWDGLYFERPQDIDAWNRLKMVVIKEKEGYPEVNDWSCTKCGKAVERGRGICAGGCAP